MASLRFLGKNLTSRKNLTKEWVKPNPHTMEQIEYSNRQCLAARRTSERTSPPVPGRMKNFSKVNSSF
ncbi:18598_t:CDS:2 [Acaulospora morrowiae]|uniref:18598_t:CDS:1 n=1 Tax=Acaulospora morrowiae TaxID=94023 RepID=A0A9N9DD89_9GLOM|nr:18598_t:CDS:2 [Acaulospora morrowiae]